MRPEAAVLGALGNSSVEPVPVTPASSESSRTSSMLAPSSIRAPRTFHAFELDWERHCKTLEQKFRYLLQLEGSDVTKMFGNNLGLDTGTKRL